MFSRLASKVQSLLKSEWEDKVRLRRTNSLQEVQVIFPTRHIEEDDKRFVNDAERGSFRNGRTLALCRILDNPLDDLFLSVPLGGSLLSLFISWGGTSSYGKDTCFAFLRRG
ncbi:hypothetical protein RJT34_16097 [Clitoria ternatea]|uniref:Uncharacterized protein n=1 Tax=Clitoria ternatea TaxID=43366 RepID=A0AAN9J7Q9_CLITE